MQKEQNVPVFNRKDSGILKRCIASALVLTLVGSPFTPFTNIIGKNMSIVASADETCLVHEYGTPVYTWSADYSTCNAKASCVNCDFVANETVTTQNTRVQAPTCEEYGTTRYTASFVEYPDAFLVQRKNVNDVPPLGHVWGDPQYTWSSDNKTVTGTVYCDRDLNHKHEITVYTEKSVKTPATCDSNGVNTYTASFAGYEQYGFTTQKKDVTEVPAVGHDYQQPTYSWSADYTTVTATIVCTNNSAHNITETVRTTESVKKNPTCDTKGIKTYTAAFSNSLFTTQTKDVENIPALEHRYAEPTYVWANDYSSVKATMVCENDPEHTITETVRTTNRGTKEPTCEEKGETTYYATFTNPAFHVDPKTVEDVPAAGHNWGEPTYEWINNNSQVVAKVVCRSDYRHTKTMTVNTTSEVTTPPTSSSYGTTKYTASFGDNEYGFTTQEHEEQNISPLGYVFATPVYEWADDYSSVTATIECTNDPSQTIVETVNTRAVNTKLPTCDEKGTTTYVSAAFVDSRLTEQRKSVDNVDALGHDYEEPTYEWSADNSEVTATLVCKRDSSHNIVEVVRTTGRGTKLATCEENGETTYTALFSDEHFTRQVKTVENVSPTGHDWDNPTYTWSNDYSKVVAKTVCKHDSNHVHTEEVNTTSSVTTEATASTNGKTTYTAEFADGNEFNFTTQEKTVENIPAFGYDFSAPQYEWAADYSTVTATLECTNDASQTVTETVNTTNRVVKDPTCDEKGKTKYTAKFEDDRFTEQSKTVEDIPALQHDYAEPTYTWADDYSTVTATRVCKNDPSHIETETVETEGKGSKAPTCEENGLTVYTATFSNSAFSVAPKTVENDNDARGHDWDNPEYVWSNDYTKVTATVICKHDTNHKKVVTVETTSEVTTPVTCDENGVTTYTATFEDNEYGFTTQEKAVADIPKLGHNYQEPVYVWADDLSTVTATIVCVNNPDDNIVEVADVVVTTKPATCEKNGTTTYTAEFTDNRFVTQKKEFDDIPALGHTYGEPEYVWADDNSTVTATVVCENDPEHIITETARVTGKGTKLATCDEKGETTYTALFNDDHFTKQTKTVDNIPALGHDWDVPTYKWSNDYSTLTAKVICKNDPNHFEEKTVETTSEITVPATCEEKGTTTYTATFEENEFGFETQNKDVVNIDALGHDYQEPEYEWAEDNSTVTATIVCLNDATHNIVEKVETTSKVKTPATCENAGTTTYTAVFEDKRFEKQTKDVDNLPALNHKYGEPTYEWAEDYSTVTATMVCENDPEHIITETVETQSKGYKHPTCEANGQTIYSATFANNAFSVEPKIVENDNDALGHDWGNPQYIWSNDNKTVTAKVICKNDSNHTKELISNVTSEVKTPATCEEKGVTTYTAVFEENEYGIVTQTKDETDIPALEHDYQEPVYEWAEDLSTVTATIVCLNDEAHNIVETVEVTSEITTPATCEAKGITTYKAEFTDSRFETQTKDIDNVPALGHEYGEPTYKWAEDNSEVTATVVCANDPDHEHDIIETVKTTSKGTKLATCEENGETTYTALFVDEHFTRQIKTVDNVPALGHDWDVPTYKWSNDYSTVTAKVVCKNDPNHIEEKVVETTNEITVPATCEDMGTTTYTATFETNDFGFETQTKDVVNVKALGHDYQEPVYDWAEDYSTVTATIVCLNDEAHNIVETVETTSKVTTPATCENVGTTTYTAVFEDKRFEKQTKAVDNLPALNHKYGEPTYEWAEDLSTVTATMICENDPEHIVTETAPVTSKGIKAATCEENGTTVYTALFENDAFKPQEKKLDDIPATGHDWGVPTYKWSNDNKTLTATVVCKNDANDVKTVTVEATSEVTTPATCENNGITTYTAAFEENEYGFETQVKPVDDIPALGHDYQEPVYEWVEDLSTVTATIVCLNDEAHNIVETAEVTSEITTPATCEEDGTTTYTAEFTDSRFETQTKDVVNVPAIGHKYGEPTYEWSEDNSEVTATMICENDPEHIVTETAKTTSKGTKLATCETNGTTTYTAIFKNNAFETQIKDVDNIPAFGHDWAVPTYNWSNDNTEVTATVVCKNDANHVVTVTVETTSEVTTPVTCEENGITTYTATFEENEYGFEAQVKAVDDIPALGHDYQEPVYEWSEDNSTVTATIVCLNNEADNIVVTVETTSEITIPATCEEDGTTTYTAEFKDKRFVTQTKDVVNVPALDHKYAEPTYEWAEDNSTVTATMVCENDPEHIVTETADATGKGTKLATCETNGTTTYTAIFENEAFETQIKKVDNIAAFGHDWAAPTYKWSNDNTTVTATVVCKNDASHVVTVTVETTGEVTTPVTCEENGVTTYTATFEENEYGFETQVKAVDDIPALGHDYQEPVYEWSEDNSTVTATIVCLNNEADNIVVTVKTTSEVTIPATCEEDGTTTYTAEFKDKRFATQTKDVVNVPAIGHKYGEPTYVWSEDNSTVTATMICENDPEHIVTETTEATSKGTKRATCEEDGLTIYTAIFDNDAFETQVKKLDEFAATGHDWDEPTYKWSKDNTTLTATVECKNDARHIETVTVDVQSEVTTPATCEKNGTTTYTAVFEENEFGFETQTKTEDNIDAIGHKYGTPTYAWAPDNSTVTATAICENDKSHVFTETVEVTSAVTTDPTCNTNGVTTYTATFTSDLFETQTMEVEDVAAIGHNYVNPTYEWSEDGKTCIGTAVCENHPEHILTSVADITSEVKREPTCDTKGIITYTATFKLSPFTQQTLDVESLPTTGHKYKDPVYIWSDDGKECMAVMVCEYDESHVRVEEATITSEVKTPATTDTKGTTTYTATFNDPAFESQTKDVEDIPVTDKEETSDPQKPVRIGIYGDVDGDGRVTAKDGLLLQRYTLKLEELSDRALILADVTGDGKATGSDVLAILRYTVKSKTSERVGKECYI